MIKIYPPFIAIFFALVAWLIKQAFPLTMVNETLYIAGFTLMGVGILIDLLSLGLFFKAKTTPHPFKEKQTSRLVTYGIYRLSRNPMYLGLLFLLTGWVVILNSLYSLISLPFFVLTINHLQIKREEKMLNVLFKDEYQRYKRSVRRWI